MEKEDYEREVRKCVRQFWSQRKGALTKNKKGKRKDAGSRGGATAGKNLDGFALLLTKQILEAATGEVEVHERKKLVTLPGYYRPTKQWDIVVTHQGRLLATIELKSLGGPSFGNNANNRCEEAIGSAIDLRTVQRKGGFGKGESPFLGFFVLVHDAEGSRKEPKNPPSSPHFDCDSIFANASYHKRMAILCERMMQEGLYGCAAAMASPKESGKSGDFSELSQTASFFRLIIKLKAHIHAESSLL